MKFLFCHDQAPPESPLLVLGVFEGSLGEAPQLDAVDGALGGKLRALAEEERFEGKSGQSLVVHTLGSLRAARVQLVGLGKREEFEVPDTRRLGAAAALEAGKRSLRALCIALPAFDATAAERSVQFLVEGVLLGSYRFDRYLGKERRREEKLEQVTLSAPRRDSAEAEDLKSAMLRTHVA